MGSKNSKAPRKFTPEEDERIRTLHHEGSSGFAIAKILSRNDASVYGRFKKLGLKAHQIKLRSKKLTTANAALRRVNGKGPKVRLTVIIGRLVQRPRLKIETFNTVEAAQKCVTRNVLEGREVHLYKEIEFELTAELKGRVE